MKKLIVLSVVFALAVGAAFAVDLGGTVIGKVGLLTSGDDIGGGAEFGRLRLEGSGEAGDGKFGGWLRLGNGTSPGFNGLAWWKPIDQFKLTIGGNPDAFWGKEGVTGWMFGQMAYDSGVTLTENNVWGGGGLYGTGLTSRTAFFGGFDGNGLLFEIKPVDMLGINIALPYFKGGLSEDNPAAKLEDIFKDLIAQVDLNLSFGNIAITYKGAPSYIQNGNVDWVDTDGGILYAYFGLSAIENLGLDVGLGFQLPNEDGTLNPFAIGLGVKYAAGAFGVKLRTTLSFPLDETFGPDFKVLADVLPYYAVNDGFRIFLDVGLGLRAPKSGDATVGWHANPWVEVGNEWGPAFYAGFKATQVGDGDLTWALPIGIIVSF